MSDHGDDETGWFHTDEPLVRRTGLSGHLRRWVLIDGNRWLLAAMLAGFVFSFVLAVGVLDGGIRAAMQSKDPVETAFSGLATGIITGVTLVVTIDQLVLSRQLGPLAEQRDQLDESLQFHREVEQLVDGTSPAEPGRFIAAVVSTIDDRAGDLTEAVANADGELTAAVEQFVADHETTRNSSASAVRRATSGSTRSGRHSSTTTPTASTRPAASAESTTTRSLPNSATC